MSILYSTAVNLITLPSVGLERLAWTCHGQQHEETMPVRRFCEWFVRSEVQISRNKHHIQCRERATLPHSAHRETAHITAAQMCQHSMVLVQRANPGQGAFREAWRARLKYPHISPLSFSTIVRQGARRGMPCFCCRQPRGHPLGKDGTRDGE